jgi:hypothetical protein
MHGLLTTFVKNGKIFSSHPEYFIKTRTILRGWGIVGTLYGDTWQVDTILDLQLCLGS